jgi:hypothetical protein
VDQHSRAFIGIDTSKLRNAVAVAEEGRDGEVRYLGEIDTTEAATRKLVAKLAAANPSQQRMFKEAGRPQEIARKVVMLVSILRLGLSRLRLLF